MARQTREAAVGDPEEVVEVANELLQAVFRLEAGVGGEIDRERVRRRLTPLDTPAGQPLRLDLGDEVTLYAGRERPHAPALELGSRPADKALAAAARWAVMQLVRAGSVGHVRAEVDAGGVRAAATDAYGAALLRIAEQLVGERAPAVVGRRRRCVRCGKDITHQRSTRRYCGSACKQAMLRARKRARGEVQS